MRKAVDPFVVVTDGKSHFIKKYCVAAPSKLALDPLDKSGTEV